MYLRTIQLVQLQSVESGPLACMAACVVSLLVAVPGSSKCRWLSSQSSVLALTI